MTGRFCRLLEKSIGVGLCPRFSLSGEVLFQKDLLWDCSLRDIMSGALQYGFIGKIIEGSEYQTWEIMLEEKGNYWAAWEKDGRDFNNLLKEKWVLEDAYQLSPSTSKDVEWAEVGFSTGKLCSRKQSWPGSNELEQGPGTLMPHSWKSAYNFRLSPKTELQIAYCWPEALLIP